jgi:hypothetical protein
MEDKMASGGTRMKCGSFTGTGAAKDITSVGFKPRRVKLYGPGTGDGDYPATFEWNEAMDDATGFLTDSDGTQDVTTYVSSAGLTPSATGFSIGTGVNAVNADGIVVYWEAHE